MKSRCDMALQLGSLGMFGVDDVGSWFAWFR